MKLFISVTYLTIMSKIKCQMPNQIIPDIDIWVTIVRYSVEHKWSKGR